MLKTSKNKPLSNNNVPAEQFRTTFYIGILTDFINDKGFTNLEYTVHQ